MFLLINYSVVIINAQEWSLIKKEESGLLVDPTYPIIETMVIDDYGTHWYGSIGGLSKFENGKWDNYSMNKQNAPFSDVYALKIDSLNKLYIGAKEGLFTLHNNLWDTLSAQLPFQGVNDIYIAGPDSLFIGSNNGFYKITKDSTKHFGHPEVPSGYIRKIVSYNDTSVVVCFDSDPYYFEGGPQKRNVIGIYDGKNWVQLLTEFDLDIESPPFASQFKDIAVDTTSKVWIATSNNGVIILNPMDSTVQYLRKDDLGIFNNTLYSITYDSVEHRMWFGGIAEIVEINPYSKEFSLNDYINMGSSFGHFKDLYLSQDGYLWFTSHGEVGKLKNNNWNIEHSFLNDGLQSNQVISMECFDNTCFIGMQENGMAIMSDGFWRVETLRRNLIPNEARDFCQDNKGNIWISTLYGIYKYGVEGLEYQDEINSGLPYHIVRKLEFDSIRNGLWVATNASKSLGNGGNGNENLGGLGFYSFDTESWTYFEPEYSLEDSGYNVGQWIWDIILDHNNHIWVSSTYTSNPLSIILSKYDGSDWEIWNPINTPDLQLALDLQIDNNNDLWFCYKNTPLYGKHSNGEIEHFEVDSPFGSFSFQSMFVDNDTIWGGAYFPSQMFSFTQGEYDWDINNLIPFEDFYGIRTIVKDSNQNLYFGSFDSGIIKYVRNNYHHRIWPGDCNTDGIVNMDDFLTLMLAQGESGTPRPLIDQHIIWKGVSVPYWNKMVANNIDISNLDCNGDGLVDLNDTLAISQNYSKKHEILRNNKLGKLGISLQFDKNNYQYGEIAKADIIVEEDIYETNILGMWLSIQHSEHLSFKEFLPNGWLCSDDDCATLVRNHNNYSTTIGISRYDKNEVLGSGLLGVIHFDVVSAEKLSNTNINITEHRAIDIQGKEKFFNPQQTSISINSESSDNLLKEDLINVFPSLVNISSRELYISNYQRVSELLIYDTKGHLIFQNAPEIQNYVVFPHTGLYFYQLKDKKGNTVKSGKLLCTD